MKKTVSIIFLLMLFGFGFVKFHSSVLASKAEASDDCQALHFCQTEFEKCRDVIDLALETSTTKILSLLARDFSQMAEGDGVLDIQKQYFLLVSIRLQKRIAEMEGRALPDEIYETYDKIFIGLSKKMEDCGINLPNI